jgi:hypothetical protein
MEKAPNYNIIHDLINDICNNLNNQLQDYIVVGLKRKGFEFKNKLELEQFVKDRCRCEDSIDLKERVYFVDDIPFFLHNYKIKIDLNPITENRCTKMSANYGCFAYL